MANPQKTYIIAIGIDKYKWSGINNFRSGSCKNDCVELVKLLLDKFQNFEQFGKTLLDGKATKNNITKLIKSFINDEQKNNTDNSLIIYFSGHGEVIQEGVNGQVGCWVPHDCEKLIKDEVLGNRVLIDIFTDVKTRDFLLISDSCNAGELFVHEFKDQVIQAMAPQNPLLSRWAMVSSSMDQRSIAKGQHSFFTGRLLQALNEIDKPEFYVTDLITSVTKLFEKTTVQTPICGRLQFQQMQNRGEMTFSFKEEIALLKKAKPFLKKELYRLNYKKQGDELREFNTRVKKHLVIFSGEARSALDHLSYRAYFRAKLEESNTTRQAVVPIVSDSGDSYVLSILNQALPVSLQDKPSAAQYLSNLLQNWNLLYEIQISDPQLLLPETKFQLVEEFRDFLQTVTINPDSKMLAFFIVDSTGTTYKQPSQLDPALNFINTTKVTGVTEQDYEDFCDLLRDNFVADPELVQWTQLREKRIDTAVAPLFGTPDCLPKTFIETICKAAGCQEIIIKLLNPY